MVSEWSVEAGPDDPVLVVPWSDPSDPTGNRRFIDLRENPYDLDHLPEAEHYPPLMHALRALNAPRSAVFTAKCDAWPIEDADELESLRLNLDIPAEEAPAGFESYIDVVWRERSVFASFHRHEQLLHRMNRLAEALDHPYAMADFVLRPALLDLTGPQEGFAMSVYVKAVGHDMHSAEVYWAAALGDVAGLLRAKEMAWASRTS